MKKVKFKTMLGDTVSVAAWMFEKAKVEKAAEKFFGVKVICCAGMYGNGHIGAGWQCRAVETNKIVGYLSLSAEQFHSLEDYEYGISIFIPLCATWTELPYGRICYVEDNGGSIVLGDGLS